MLRSVAVLALAWISAVGVGATEPGEVSRAIDRHIQAQLQKDKVAASPPTSDAEFLRRVCLDLTGRLPSAARAAAFLDDRAPDRRGKLIDELLESPHYGQHFGTILTNVVRVHGDPVDLFDSSPLAEWLGEQFNQGRGWDQVAREILTVEGDKPPAVFYHATRGQPGLLASSTGRLFLGVQFQCAECHDHPFADWKQTDYWGMAAFFGKVVAVKGNDNSILAGPVVETARLPGPKIAQHKISPTGAITVPATGGNRGAGKVIQARLLGGQEQQLATEHFRPALAVWVAAPENPYFARAAVNRLWAHLLGRGFVNPVDDFRPDNEPSHPELLDLLAREFIASGFSHKHLIRCICNSETYQRSSQVLPGNKDHEHLFARSAVRVMTPEMIFDNVDAVLGTELGKVPPPKKTNAARKSTDTTPREQFLHLYATRSNFNVSVEYTHGIPQVFRLLNARQTTASSPTVEHLVAAKTAPEQALDELFLRTLSRRPSPDERARMMRYVESRPNLQAGLDGVLWVLINANEFVVYY